MHVTARVRGSGREAVAVVQEALAEALRLAVTRRVAGEDEVVVEADSKIGSSIASAEVRLASLPGRLP